jgi:hypothetical protein
MRRGRRRVRKSRRRKRSFRKETCTHAHNTKHTYRYKC